MSEQDPVLDGTNADSTCFACGPRNERGLRLRFSLIDGAMGAEWTPEADFEGYAGVIHGGLVSTVLDEAMAKIVSATVGKALTAELRVRFRRTVASGSTVEVRGWIESRERRMIRTEAALCSLDGEELAHGWGTFLAVK